MKKTLLSALLILSSSMAMAVEGVTLTQYSCQGRTFSGKSMSFSLCAAAEEGQVQPDTTIIGGITSCQDGQTVLFEKIDAYGNISYNEMFIGSDSYFIQSEDGIEVLVTDSDDYGRDPQIDLFAADLNREGYKTLRFDLVAEAPGYFAMNLQQNGWLGYEFNQAECFAQSL